MVQKMSEIEQGVLAKSKSLGEDGCIGRTKAGRDEAALYVKEKLEEFQDECRKKLEEFGLGKQPGIYTHEANIVASKVNT
jgi:hypothetical protein